MTGAQAASKYDNPQHPLHKFLKTPKPPRNMKETPASFYKKFIPQKNLTEQQKVKKIHADIVRDSLTALETYRYRSTTQNKSGCPENFDLILRDSAVHSTMERRHESPLRF